MTYWCRDCNWQGDTEETSPTCTHCGHESLEAHHCPDCGSAELVEVDR